MEIKDAVCDFIKDHPILTTGMVCAAGYGIYKVANNALDVAERTTHRAMKHRYSVSTPKCYIRPEQSVSDEEPIYEEEELRTAIDKTK